MQFPSYTNSPAAFWRSALGEIRQLRSITGTGILAALGTAIKVLTSFLVGEISKISFIFITQALSGYLYGPIMGGICGALVDLLGMLIRPDGTPFFGFTVSAFISGFIFGCWLYRHPVRVWRIVAACVTNMLVVSLVVNPLWLVMLTGSAWPVLVVARLPLNFVQLAVNITALSLLLPVIERQRRRVVQG